MDKKQGGVNGAGRIRSERLKEYQYKEEYVRALDSMKVKWDEISDAKQMGGTGKPSRLTAQKNIWRRGR